jgi:hypothetical protein
VNTYRTIDGLLHAHASAGDASEYMGVLALGGGAVLVALAIPFLHLGEGPASRGRRRVYRAAAAVASSLVIFAAVYPITQIVGTHEHRKPIGDQARASDGPVTSPVRQPVRGPDR